MSLSSLSGRESAVYLWGDGHTAPTELDKDAIGFVASVALGAGTRACLTNQSALFHWDASVDVNGLPSYTPRRLGESKFKCVSAGQGFISAIHRSPGSWPTQVLRTRSTKTLLGRSFQKTNDVTGGISFSGALAHPKLNLWLKTRISQITASIYSKTLECF